jgi:hypothetical protein
MWWCGSCVAIRVCATVQACAPSWRNRATSMRNESAQPRNNTTWSCVPITRAVAQQACATNPRNRATAQPRNQHEPAQPRNRATSMRNEPAHARNMCIRATCARNAPNGGTIASGPLVRYNRNRAACNSLACLIVIRIYIYIYIYIYICGDSVL